MLNLSETLLLRLTENVQEWDLFESGQIGYLLPHDNDPPTRSQALQLSVDNIRTDISRLRGLIATLTQIQQNGKDKQLMVSKRYMKLHC